MQIWQTIAVTLAFSVLYCAYFWYLNYRASCLYWRASVPNQPPYPQPINGRWLLLLFLVQMFAVGLFAPTPARQAFGFGVIFGPISVIASYFLTIPLMWLIGRITGHWFHPFRHIHRQISAGQPELALRDLNHYIYEKGPTPQALSLQEMLLLHLKRWRDVFEVAKNYESQFGRHFEMRGHEARALWHLGRKDEALSTFEDAVRLAGANRIPIHCYFASIFVAENELELAHDHYLRAKQTVEELLADNKIGKRHQFVTQVELLLAVIKMKECESTLSITEFDARTQEGNND